MKKLTLTFVCLLCFAFCLTFASCSHSDGDCEHVWDEGKVIVEGDCTHEKEIRYTCTLCGEKKIEKTDGHAWNEGKKLAAATCQSTGSMLYICTKCNEKKTVEIPIDPTAHTLESGGWRIVSPPTALKDGVTERVCTTCGEAVKSSVTYADYSSEVAEMKGKAAGFKNSDFGSGSVRTDLGGSYDPTPVKPTAKQHPRVLFNESNLAGIRAELYESRSAYSAGLFRQAVKKPTDGKLSSSAPNFSGDVLNAIQAMALDYQLTKNEISGYGAIYALKNALATLNYSGISSDSTRYYGYTMYIAACVYDWCYGLLTGTDREQIVLGVQEKICKAGMEVGFPPSGKTAISGHGAEFGILRDYLSFAIAVYDEYPGWWDYIGGRFYQEYVPVRNEFYRAGMVPQGISLYIQTRYGADIYSAWLIKAMTGSVPYDAANMKQVARSIYSHELPGTYGTQFYLGFNTGDDHVPDGSFIDYSHIALISSYLFDDATMRAELEYYKTNCTVYKYVKDPSGNPFSPISDASVSEYLICSSSGVKAAEDRHEGLDLILYNGGWLGQIIAHSSWGNDQAAVLMKIGVRTTANHDHQDAGQFQIFYKSILAGDTGAYVSYGEDHHYFYHQATIAHNSLLIYNPSLEKNAEYKSKSGSAYYYSGGQRFVKSGEVGGTVSDWLGASKYKTGEVKGMEYRYADEQKTKPVYAYIAGDIAAAYGSSTASEVTRRMLAVYDTGNPNVPMFFFVFDNITAIRGNYKKTFLLHVPTEPTISGKTVTVVNGGGKLVLQNVIGNNTTVTGVGGVGKNYYVNKNGANSYVQLNNSYSRDDEFWGRVEISPATGNKTDQLLNVMYVCDASKNLGLPASAISTDEVKGAVIGKVAAIFVTSATRRSAQFTFSTSGSGDVDYYVSGVKAGNWRVEAGSKTQIVTATEEGGFLAFSAPAGSVTLSPVN